MCYCLSKLIVNVLASSFFHFHITECCLWSPEDSSPSSRSVSASSCCFSIFPSKTEISLFFLIWAHAVVPKSRTWIWALMRKPPLITGAVSFSTCTSDRIVCPVVVVPGSWWFKISLRLVPNSDKCITLVWVRWMRKKPPAAGQTLRLFHCIDHRREKTRRKKTCGIICECRLHSQTQESLWWGD